MKNNLVDIAKYRAKKFVRKENSLDFHFVTVALILDQQIQLLQSLTENCLKRHGMLGGIHVVQNLTDHI